MISCSDNPIDIRNQDGCLNKRMLLEDAGVSKINIYVEGPDDVTVYSNLVDSDYCQIELVSSKNGDELCRNRVVAIVSEANKRHMRGILGIIDKDFYHLLGKQEYFEENVFVTDDNDLESQILHTNILKRLLKILADPKKLAKWQEKSGINIEKHIIDLAKKMGAIRVVAYKNCERISFQNPFVMLHYLNYIDSNFKLKEEEYISVLLNLNKNKLDQEQPLTLKEYKWLVQEVESKIEDPWDYIRGHDLVAIIGTVFWHNRNYNLSKKSDERDRAAQKEENDYVPLLIPFSSIYFDQTARNEYKDFVKFAKNRRKLFDRHVEAMVDILFTSYSPSDFSETKMYLKLKGYEQKLIEEGIISHAFII